MDHSPNSAKAFTWLSRALALVEAAWQKQLEQNTTSQHSQPNRIKKFFWVMQ
jgi:hypothetical protein